MTPEWLFNKKYLLVLLPPKNIRNSSSGDVWVSQGCVTGDTFLQEVLS